MDTCPAGTTFDLPRTALENRFLLAAMRKADITSIWIDLNSLKAPNCWTVGNANCPYGDSVHLPPFPTLVLSLSFHSRSFLGAWLMY